MINIVGHLILAILYCLVLRKMYKKTINFLNKYYFTLKEAMKMLDHKEQKELLDKIKKEFGEW